MSRVRAVVEVEYSPAMADAITKALQADNVNNGRTRVMSYGKGGIVVSEIESSSLEKMLPVLDDLLFCQALSYKTLQVAARG